MHRQTAGMSVATAPPPSPRRIFGELLVASGRLSEARRDRLLELQAEEGEPEGSVSGRRRADERRPGGQRLGELGREMGWLTPDQIARTLADQLLLPFVEAPIPVDPEAARLLPADVVRTLRVIPLSAEARSLTVAVADPLDPRTLEDLRFRTGRRIELRVATSAAIEEAIARVHGDEVARLAELIRGRGDAGEGADRDALERAVQAGPVVRLVDRLLEEAARKGASDLHFEPVQSPDGEGLHVRMRVDGILRSRHRLPEASRAVVVSRLKVMAGMDISVRRRPQDGGFRAQLGGRELALRVSTLPAGSSEKAVVRLLDPEQAPADLGDLGLSAPDVARLREVLAAGQGVVLATGPTGSGKSSTLHAALQSVDRTGRNVITLEDPVEYAMEGVTQVQVDPRAGLTFPTALRAVLRQDPDVVMVGEVRDAETARIAMAAAVTGHLVLSTLHTTDAPGALTRLIHMGVPPYLVAGGVSAIVAQRLVRRSCPECGGRSCLRCEDGYTGRVGVFQLLVMNDALRDAVVAGASTPTLRRLARETGMRTLAEDARRQVAERRTTPHEVGRVVRSDPGSIRPCAGCGEGVPSGASGCPWCGTSQEIRCRCGTRFEGGWRFCPSCLRPRGHGD